MAAEQDWRLLESMRNLFERVILGVEDKGIEVELNETFMR